MISQARGTTKARIRTSIHVAFVLLLTMMASSLARATSEVVRDPKSWDFAPLLYYDRVVHGTVVSSSMTEIGAADLSMYPPDLRASAGNPKISVVSVTMNISEVLRGAPSAPVETFLAVGDVFESLGAYSDGVEVLVCMKYHPLLRTYYQGSSYGIYRRTESGWRSLETARGRRSFTDSEIRAKVASMGLEQVARDAELVVEGDVQSVEWSEFYSPDSSSAQLVTLDINVRSVEKGVYSDKKLVVRALGEGMYLPVWRKRIPRSFEVGQRWICFLQKNEIGWYPFAGSNGLFQVEQDSLIYDDRVRFWHSPNEVRAAARQSKPRE